MSNFTFTHLALVLPQPPGSFCWFRDADQAKARGLLKAKSPPTTGCKFQGTQCLVTEKHASVDGKERDGESGQGVIQDSGTSPL